MRHGVAVEHPHEAAVRRDHEVRVTIEQQERKRALRTLTDVTVVEDPRTVREISREKNVERPEAHRVQRSPQERSDRDSAGAVVLRIRRRVTLARRIVELTLPARREHEVVRHLAVVDLRARDAHLDGRDRREVLDEQDRKPLARDGVRRA